MITPADVERAITVLHVLYCTVLYNARSNFALKPERAHPLIHDRVAPFQDAAVNVLEVMFHRIDVLQPKFKRAAVCHEFWVPK